MIQQIFSTPIFITKLPNHEKVKEQFLPFLKDNKYFAKAEGWHGNLDTTFPNEPVNELPWQDFFSSAVNVAAEFIKEIGVINNVQFHGTAWLNRYYNGNYQEIHNHIGNNNAISCAYMLELPNESGNFVFFKEGQDFWNDSIRQLCHDFDYSNRYTPKLEEGDIVFFPSNLSHYVTYNNSNNRRATISANFKVVQA